MQPQLTPEQLAYLNQKMPQYITEMFNRFEEVIVDIDTRANADFTQAGIELADHAVVNPQFLMATTIDQLFAQLHQGNKETAKLIISMMARQAEIPEVLANPQA